MLLTPIGCCRSSAEALPASNNSDTTAANSAASSDSSGMQQYIESAIEPYAVTDNKAKKSASGSNSGGSGSLAGYGAADSANPSSSDLSAMSSYEIVPDELPDHVYDVVDEDRNEVMRGYDGFSLGNNGGLGTQRSQTHDSTPSVAALTSAGMEQLEADSMTYSAGPPEHVRDEGTDLLIDDDELASK